MNVIEIVEGFLLSARKLPSWSDGYGHEKWVAVELASYLRREHGMRCVLEVPYVVTPVTPASPDAHETKYADVYAIDEDGIEEPRHLFIELKGIPEGAASAVQTAQKFCDDVAKLARAQRDATATWWTNKNDAWCTYLGPARERLRSGTVAGLALLVVGTDLKGAAVTAARSRLGGGDVQAEELHADEQPLPGGGSVSALAYHIPLR